MLGTFPWSVCNCARYRSRPSGFINGSMWITSWSSKARVSASVPAASRYATVMAASVLDSSSPWMLYANHATAGIVLTISSPSPVFLSFRGSASLALFFLICSSLA